MAECDLDYVIKAENHNADWRDRYEATLQAKDATITELGRVCWVALDALGCDRIAQARLDAQRIIHAAVKKAGIDQWPAIKEAT